MSEQRSATVRHLIAACVLIVMAGIAGCPERRPTPVPTTDVEQAVKAAVREYVLAHAEAEDAAAADIDNGKLKGSADYQERFSRASAQAKERFAQAILDAMNEERPAEGLKADFHRAAARGYRGAVR